MNETFGRPGASRGSSAYPQIRFVSLVENGTHVLFGSRMAGKSCSWCGSLLVGHGQFLPSAEDHHLKALRRLGYQIPPTTAPTTPAVV